MKTLILISGIILLFSFSNNLYGQDKIYKKNKEVILCKVIEIDGNYIKYSQPEYNESVTFNIAKSKVSKIVYENGSVMDFEQAKREEDNRSDYSNEVDFSSNKKNAIKLDFFAPMVGNITFGYERSLGKQKSIDATVGIIGIGGDFNPVNIFFFMVPNTSAHDWNNPFGMFVKVGYKIMRSPEIYSHPHILKGSYLRPEVIFTYFTADEKIYYDNPQPGQDIYSITTNNQTVYSFMLNAGKQWIFQDIFLLDWHIGIGYGFGTGTQGGYYYSQTIGSSSFPIAITTGLKIGVLF